MSHFEIKNPSEYVWREITLAELKARVKAKSVYRDWQICSFPEGKVTSVGELLTELEPHVTQPVPMSSPNFNPETANIEWRDRIRKTLRENGVTQPPRRALEG